MNARFIKELAIVITQIDDQKIAEDFLKNILTPIELEEISVRLQIFKHLMAGMPQRKIAKLLGVGIATISRGARELKYGVPGITKILK